MVMVISFISMNIEFKDFRKKWKSMLQMYVATFLIYLNQFLLNSFQSSGN